MNKAVSSRLLFGNTDIRVSSIRKRKMAALCESTASEPSKSSSTDPEERLKRLYPTVNEEESPLPRAWSAKDKFNYLGLSQENLRVHYKGICFGLHDGYRQSSLTFFAL